MNFWFIFLLSFPSIEQMDRLLPQAIGTLCIIPQCCVSLTPVLELISDHGNIMPSVSFSSPLSNFLETRDAGTDICRTVGSCVAASGTVLPHDGGGVFVCGGW